MDSMKNYGRKKSFPGHSKSAAGTDKQPSTLGTSTSTTEDEDEFFEHRLKDEVTEPLEDTLMSEQNGDAEYAIQEPFDQQGATICDTIKVEDIKDHFEVDEGGPFSYQRTNEDGPCDEDTLNLYEEASKSKTKNAVSDKQRNIKQEEYSCNVCSGSIVGFRYTCVHCADYDICGSCEARGPHPLHYVLRVPGQRPHAEVQDMLQRIRRVLLKDTIVNLPPSKDVEVKEKPVCEAPVTVEPSVDDFELLERDPLEVKQEPVSPKPTETVPILTVNPTKKLTDPAWISTKTMQTHTEPVRTLADPTEKSTDPVRISKEALRIPTDPVWILTGPSETLTDSARILSEAMQIPAESVLILADPTGTLTDPARISTEPMRILSNSAQILPETVRILPKPVPEPTNMVSKSPQKRIASLTSNGSSLRSDAPNQNTFVPQQLYFKRRIENITLPPPIKRQMVNVENSEVVVEVERTIKPIDEMGRKIMNRRSIKTPLFFNIARRLPEEEPRELARSAPKLVRSAPKLARSAPTLARSAPKSARSAPTLARSPPTSARSPPTSARSAPTSARLGPQPQVEHRHMLAPTPARSSYRYSSCWLCANQQIPGTLAWRCLSCDVSLCDETCFRAFHTRRKDWLQVI